MGSANGRGENGRGENVDIYYQALDTCRTAARNASSDYGEVVGGGAPDRARTPTAATIFGAVDDAAGLASAVDTAWATLGDELADAKNKLLAVERALEKVEDNVGSANHATAQAMIV
jgi:hypothetical protein